MMLTSRRVSTVECDSEAGCNAQPYRFSAHRDAMVRTGNQTSGRNATIDSVPDIEIAVLAVVEPAAPADQRTTDGHLQNSRGL